MSWLISSLGAVVKQKRKQSAGLLVEKKMVLEGLSSYWLEEALR
jgi:hypothetical protein